MRQFRKNAIKLVRFLVIFLVILSLSSNGIFAAQRLIDNCAEIDKIEEIDLSESQLRQGPPSPDELPENMEDSGSPNTEQYAYNNGRLIVKLDNSQTNYKFKQQEAKKIFSNFVNTQKSRILSSTSLVHSHLGRQFTLVGAKPSGTS